MKQTLVLRLLIHEASAKIRTGPPLDDQEDYTLPVWAGVLPLTLTPQPPVADNAVELPDYVARYSRR